MTCDKTTIERLRELLDERGVEWRTYRGIEKQITCVDSVKCVYEEIERGKIRVIRYFDTPAEAIEGTLGRGECSITRDFKCSACGHQYPKTNCEPYETWDGRQGWKSLDHWELACDTPNYCPNCGRKVVDE